MVIIQKKEVKMKMFYANVSHPKRLPEFLTEHEMNKILSIKGNLRDQAILELLYASGIRVGELVRLKIGDISFQDKTFKVVQGKPHKDRYAYFNETAKRKMQEYIEKERPKTEDNTLFLTEEAKPLTAAQARNIVKKTAKEAGIAKRTYPHMFRHSFATHLLDNGANIMEIKEFLGHESVATTQVYTHLTVKRLIEVHKKFHPRENMLMLENKTPDVTLNLNYIQQEVIKDRKK